MKLSLILLVPLFFIGCLQTRSDVRAGEQGKVLQQQVSTLQKTNADVSNRFEEAIEQMRYLNGRVEVLENQVNQLKQELDTTNRNSTELNQVQSQKISLFQESITKMESDQQRQLAELAAVKSALQAEPAKSGPAQNPKVKNTFELGEILFAKKEYRQAILEYQKYREKFPKGKSVTAATYKMGVSFQELGLKDDAKAFFEEVVSRSPKSDEAKKSKARLQKLK
jgi:TolA-binding protein